MKLLLKNKCSRRVQNPRAIGVCGVVVYKQWIVNMRVMWFYHLNNTFGKRIHGSQLINYLVYIKLLFKIIKVLRFQNVE